MATPSVRNSTAGPKAHGVSPRTRFKRWMLVVLRALGVFRLARRLTRNRIRILCYHGVWLGPSSFAGDGMFMSGETFRRRLHLLRRHRYPVIALEEAVAALRGEREVPNSATVITVDDGWYSTFSDMVPALTEAGFPATLYCDTGHLEAAAPVPHVMARYCHRMAGSPPLTGNTKVAFDTATNLDLPAPDRLTAALALAAALKLDAESLHARRVFGYMTPAELLEAHRAGVDVQLHTHSHSIHDHLPNQIEAELRANRTALHRMLGGDPHRFRHFCYPSGISSPAAVAALEGAGILSATTTRSGMAARGMSLHLLPRLLDGEGMSEIEFEAELCGLAGALRRMARQRSASGYSSRPESGDNYGG